MKSIFSKIPEKVNYFYTEKIDLKIVSYDNTYKKVMEIINTIRDMYSHAVPEKIRETIEKHFVPTDEEKKNNAEIPTPVALVDEMLDKIPAEFWTTSKAVLEPCCGKGNFLLGIFDKFYDGLKEKYMDERERCEVIITKCLYYADITHTNVFIATEILKRHIHFYTGQEELDYSFNSYTGDTLLMKNQFEVVGFDAVIGNPPYNASGATGTGNTIWQNFTTTSLKNWLVPNGYLLFVHPPGWRKPDSHRGRYLKMFDMMTKENQMLYLQIHGLKDGKKVFNCGTRYDWYLIEKLNKYKDTEILDENNDKYVLDLNCFKWLPNSNITEISKLLATDNNAKCNIMYNTPYHSALKKQMSLIQIDDYQFPCIHTTPKTEPRIMYSKVNNKGHFGVSKVIFGDSGIRNPIIDMEGKYGMTEHSMAIHVSSIDEAINISNAIKSKKFDRIVKSCSFSTYQIDWRMFKEFKVDFWKEFV